ncbi:MAG: DUF1365 domain-containing protein [Chloroflexota bacterium]
MRSHLLAGKVRHRRSRPIVYELEHDVFYVALDLAELDAVDARLRLFGRNRRAVLGFRDSDHLPNPSTDIDADIRAHLRAAGENPTGWRITLITNPRVFGYVFNPASFFLCRDDSGDLAVVVVEVHNTHGERHLYTLRSEAGPDRFTSAMDKDFYVSPFIDMEGRYAVHVRDDATGVRIAINERQGGEPLLSTSLILRRRPLTDRMVARMLLRHPLVTHKTIALIHWHALLLWLRGLKFFRHGAARDLHGRASAGSASAGIGPVNTRAGESS